MIKSKINKKLYFFIILILTILSCKRKNCPDERLPPIGQLYKVLIDNEDLTSLYEPSIWNAYLEYSNYDVPSECFESQNSFFTTNGTYEWINDSKFMRYTFSRNCLLDTNSNYLFNKGEQHLFQLVDSAEFTILEFPKYGKKYKLIFTKRFTCLCETLPNCSLTNDDLSWICKDTIEIFVSSENDTIIFHPKLIVPQFKLCNGDSLLTRGLYFKTDNILPRLIVQFNKNNIKNFRIWIQNQGLININSRSTLITFNSLGQSHDSVYFLPSSPNKIYFNKKDNIVGFTHLGKSYVKINN